MAIIAGLVAQRSLELSLTRRRVLGQLDRVMDCEAAVVYHQVNAIAF
jgi:hypothetical protein